MNILPLQQTQDMTTVMHIQKRIGKNFSQDCADKMFTAVAKGEYTAICDLDKADMDILRNLKYKTQEFSDECTADGKIAVIVSWKPDQYHK